MPVKEAAAPSPPTAGERTASDVLPTVFGQRIARGVLQRRWRARVAAAVPVFRDDEKIRGRQTIVQQQPEVPGLAADLGWRSVGDEHTGQQRGGRFGGRGP